MANLKNADEVLYPWVGRSTLRRRVERRDSLIAKEISILSSLQAAQKECQFLIHFELSKGGDGHHITAMEICHGGTLDLLMSQKSLKEPECLMYIAELVLALDHLRKHRIVHCDLRPDTIGLTSNGHIRVMDFEYAVLCPKEWCQIQGEPATNCMYASPELLRDGKVCLASDWWSLGVILYEMLFDTLPWYAKDVKELTTKICNEPPMDARPETLRTTSSKKLVRDLLRKDPLSRLQDLEEVTFVSVFKNLDWNAVREESWSPTTRRKSRMGTSKYRSSTS